MEQRTIELHNTPSFVREFVANWIKHMKKHGQHTPAHLAVMEDILQLLDIAVMYLQPEEPQQEETLKS